MWLPEVQTPRPAIPLLLLSLLLSSAAADPSFHRGMLADSIAREVMMQQGEEGMSPADVEVHFPFYFYPLHISYKKVDK